MAATDSLRRSYLAAVFASGFALAVGVVNFVNSEQFVVYGLISAAMAVVAVSEYRALRG